jgi:hypothetical protein
LLEDLFADPFADPNKPPNNPEEDPLEDVEDPNILFKNPGCFCVVFADISI